MKTDNVEVLTSYFYMVRFFEPYHIPFNTAMWPPKWYRRGSGDVYLDKRGVINGLTAQPLVPGRECEGLCNGRGGDGRCLTQGDAADPNACPFLIKYMEQLERINFESFKKSLMDVAWKALGEFNPQESESLKAMGESPVPVLLFHETPENTCSERIKVTRWIVDHGVTVKEFKRP